MILGEETKHILCAGMDHNAKAERKARVSFEAFMNTGVSI